MIELEIMDFERMAKERQNETNDMYHKWDSLDLDMREEMILIEQENFLNEIKK